MNRYLLELREADGRVMAEVLVYGDAAAGPVDDKGHSISYGRPIALFGRKWRLKTAERATTYVRMTCTAVPTDSEAGITSSNGLEHQEISETQPVQLDSDSGSY